LLAGIEGAADDSARMRPGERESAQAIAASSWVVSGRVTGADGAPIPGAAVSVQDDRAVQNVLHATTTDADGRFVMAGELSKALCAGGACLMLRVSHDARGSHATRLHLLAIDTSGVWRDEGGTARAQFGVILA
jgi:hypothetical protein